MANRQRGAAINSFRCVRRIQWNQARQYILEFYCSKKTVSANGRVIHEASTLYVRGREQGMNKEKIGGKRQLATWYLLEIPPYLFSSVVAAINLNSLRLREEISFEASMFFAFRRQLIVKLRFFFTRVRRGAEKIRAKPVRPFFLLRW